MKKVGIKSDYTVSQSFETLTIKRKENEAPLRVRYKDPCENPHIDKAMKQLVLQDPRPEKLLKTVYHFVKQGELTTIEMGVLIIHYIDWAGGTKYFLKERKSLND